MARKREKFARAGPKSNGAAAAAAGESKKREEEKKNTFYLLGRARSGARARPKSASL
jgi:hypothetical protein